MIRSNRGVSLLEFLICISVLAILVSGVANANFGLSRERTIADSLMTDVMSAYRWRDLMLLTKQ